jgi:hypothetical protein
MRTEGSSAGFLAGASAEIFGAGPVLKQLAAGPQLAFFVSLLIVVGSCVPFVKVCVQLLLICACYLEDRMSEFNNNELMQLPSRQHYAQKYALMFGMPRPSLLD